MIRFTFAVSAILLGVGVTLAPTAAAAYPNCTAAHADGRYDIPEGDSDYVSSQDRDGDGVACES